jgi:hypothetical protein
VLNLVNLQASLDQGRSLAKILSRILALISNHPHHHEKQSNMIALGPPFSNYTIISKISNQKQTIMIIQGQSRFEHKLPPLILNKLLASNKFVEVYGAQSEWSNERALYSVNQADIATQLFNNPFAEVSTTSPSYKEGQEEQSRLTEGSAVDGNDDDFGDFVSALTHEIPPQS